MDPLLIMVAPNGARRTKSDHPALPIGPADLAETAAACHAAGAGAIHVHVRDEAGRHCLDRARYEEAFAAIRARVGDDMVLQATTEAVGRFSPADQMAAVRQLEPRAVSIAVRELFAEGEDEPRRFLEWAARQAVAIQWILYDSGDFRRYLELVRLGAIPAAEPGNVLFVLGRYAVGQESSPADLEPYLRILREEGEEGRLTWSICAFGRGETAALRAAMEAGGHLRVGFENSLWEPDGSVAADNAARVRMIAELARAAGRRLATGAEARAILGVA
ncbi:3-keto-5-aminohexanoate cleavage protein [Propylenella binzhouense]|uniref:3-keto-5-aminohexanoate cleavage protein n=1 Tax=Propylenella binzhouense TaxID=2555902 RepID=A0A964T6T0_9HYPH|nr:3-keto-5-aminohexanoate cleavage protein [Propylenella binzhouense]MYZ49464.1 3-keto-5-aminohexanoate cleavage protein [Propylenella binzhouense]